MFNKKNIGNKYLKSGCPNLKRTRRAICKEDIFYMNPFNEKCKTLEKNFIPLKKMYPKSYNKDSTSPYTKTRVILMNGTEFESNWFMHQFARHCDNPEILETLSVVRRQEQQQQKRISCLKPLNESILETTIAYEQLAVDLTACLARNEKDENNIKALNFALLEDFDHLYRYANLLKMDKGIEADTLVGKMTEIMPGRPTVAEHRYPSDDLKPHMNAATADLYTKLVASTITAAEQQTMNYYMNIAQWYKNDLGRKLYSEIAMIEEAHVTQYESLKDPTMTWLEQWVMHEYCECWLYYSAMEDESDESIKKIWAEHFKMEVCHLKAAAKLLKKYENSSYEKCVGSGEFPKLLKLGGEMGIVGLPPTEVAPTIDAAGLIFNAHKKVYGSLIGGIKETQEMLDFSLKHKIYPETEIIAANQINEAYENLTNGKAKFRYVIDMKTLEN